MAYRGLDDLFPRPPTPPKDHTDLLQPFRPASHLDTPNTPSTSTPDYFASKLSQPISKKRKRVNFNLTPVTSDAPSSSPSILEAQVSGNLIRHSPPSRQAKRDREPVKSILKVRKQHGLLSELDLRSDVFNVDLNFSAPKIFFKTDKIRMLEETCRQLAGSDQGERLDAYRSLTTAMKKYDDMPKLDEFTLRVPAYMEYVLRDLRTRKGDDHRDAQLAVEALKLATILTWRNPPTLSENAKTELIDWCIETLKDDTAPKVIVNNTLCLLTYQSFTKSLTKERVQRILKAIFTIDSRISGIQVKILRLDIYKKLAFQCSQHMVSFASLWLGPLVEALLSDKAEVSAKALPSGREIAIALGSAIEVSRELERLLNLPIPNADSQQINPESEATEASSICYGDVLVEKLRSIAKDKVRSETAPQIWSILVLFLQRRRSVLTRAPHKQKLLEILQYCLNKVPLSTKSRAVVAWQDLIFTLQQDMHKEHSILELLGLLFTRLFQRFDNDKAMNAIESTYCTYLYYAMWPKATHDTITWVWNQKVAKIIKRDDPKNQIRPNFVLRVLAALFGTETQVAWDSKKALQTAPLQPKDLPRIDPKWVATNLQSIFGPLEDYLNVPGGDDDTVYSVWNALNKCVVDSRTHEIRPSAATMTAMASFLTNIIKYGSQLLADSTTGHQSPASIAHISRLFTSTLDVFGSIPCNEKVLTVDGDNVVHHVDLSKNVDASDDRYSALDLTISMLLSDCMLAGEAPQACTKLMEALVRHKLHPLSTRCKKLQMLAEMSQEAICEDEHVDEKGQKTHCLKYVLWREVCSSLIVILTDYSSQQTAPDSQSFGADFQQAATILVNGIKHGSQSTWSQAFTLLAAEGRAVLSESPKLAMLDAVLDPLAHGVVQSLKDPNCKKGRRNISRKLVCTILANIEWHDENDTYQQAQKSLWGAAPAVSTKNLNKLYQNVYSLFSEALTMDTRKNGPSQVIDSVYGFITRCPISQIWYLLQASTKALGAWLHARSRLHGKETGWSLLWSELCSKITAAWGDRPANYMLLLEPLLIAGMGDSNGLIVDRFVELWNDLIGSLSNVEISPELSLTLRHAAERRNVSMDCLSAQSVAQGPLAAPDGYKMVEPRFEPLTLHESPSRRDWVLGKGSRSLTEVAHEPLQPTSSPSEQEPENHSHSPLIRAQVVSVEAELPSSPPELPTITNLDDEAIPAQEGGFDALPMSDEFQHMDSSPTPLPRARPFESRSASVYDVQSSPLGAAVKQVIVRPDPAQSTAKHATLRKPRQPKSLSVSSKHFPITIDDEDALTVEAPVPQKDIERTPLSNTQARKEHPVADEVAKTYPPVEVAIQPHTASSPVIVEEHEVIDLETIAQKESISSKRKRPDEDDKAVGQPVQKRGRGRPRKHPLPASSQQSPPQQTPSQQTPSQQTLSQQMPSQTGTQPPKRGRGRPRKNTNIPPSAKTNMPISQPAPPLDAELDDDDSTIEVLSSPSARARSRSRATAPTRQGSNVVVPPSMDDTDRQAKEQVSTSTGAKGGRSDREKSADSVEFVKDTVVVDNEPMLGPNGQVRFRRTGRRGSRNQTLTPASNEQKKGRKRSHQEIEAVEQCEVPEQGERALRSPSSQLQVDAFTPSKKRKTSPEPPASPRSPLSDTALKILNNLRGMVGKLQNAVMGRTEAREIQRTLNRIGSAVHDAGSAVLDAEQRTEGQEDAHEDE